ncbi:two-component regulator propeller domain-containing protein [uncultured Polaribacter sp.]|uniref:hybrid sensor histidine kinase/response regulator transcription factor n=1 Tax=uncultured Polaribacter sp. TaxID=174711 RepID=UPI0026167547|nr:two-component regulator propeller domain-containing protein [uncultured Polaribacter sp.]
MPTKLVMFYLYTLIYCRIKQYLKIVAVLLIAFNSILSFASNKYPVKFKRLTINDGLSSDKLFSVIQDKNGFLWFGTDNGLNRYDGYSFKVFKFNPSNPRSIPSNRVQALLEDSNGNLWIGTDKGLARFDKKTANFNVFKSNPKNSVSISNNNIKDIFEDKEGDIWIGTNVGLDKIDSNNKSEEIIKFKHIPFNLFEDENFAVRSIYQDNFNNIWVATDFKLILIQKNARTKEIKKYYFSLLEGIQNKTLMDISAGRNNSLLISTYTGGLLEFSFTSQNSDSEDVNVKKYNIRNLEHLSSTKTIISSLVDSKGNLWVCTLGDGIVYLPKYQSGEDKFYRIKNNLDNNNSISSNFVKKVFEDRSGVIWLLTENNGICKYNPTTKPFVKLKDSKGFPSEVSDIRSIIEDDNGNLIVATRNSGLLKYNLNQVPHKINFQGEFENLNWTDAKNIKDIIQDSNGNYWLASDNLGIQIYNKDGKLVKQFSKNEHNSNSISNNYVYKIFEDRKGIIWIGSWGGINDGGLDRYDPNTEKFTHFGNIPNDTTSLSENIIVAIEEDHLGQIWIGTNGEGVNLVETRNNGVHIKRFKTVLNDKSSLNDDHIKDIFFGNDNSLWVSTNSGLNKYNYESQKFERINLDSNIANQQVNSSIYDSNGLLWLATPRGIIRYNHKSRETNVFTKEDGLHTGYTSALKLKKNNGLVFYGSNGVVYFEPDKIKLDKVIPPVIITDFKIFNIDVEKSKNANIQETIPNIDSITLPYSENNFQIQFSALNFIKQGKNKYAYRLDGYDEEGHWNYTGSKFRYVNYSNLKEGDYVFRVKASNSDGIWSEKVKELQITIAPPYYRTLLAYFIYFTIVAGLIFLFLILVVKREEEKNRVKMERVERQRIEELNKMKLNFFTNISHEFRTPLTLILAPVEKLLKSSTALSESKRSNLYTDIHNNASRLLKLINELMDFRKLESGKLVLKKQKLDMVNFIKNIYSYFIDIAEERNIQFKLVVPQEEIIAYLDPQHIEKVIYNLLSNSFKSIGNTGEIVLTVETDRTQGLLIKVCDNGKGIPPEELEKVFERFHQVTNLHSRLFYQQGSGIGLDFAKSLVNMHGGKISVTSKPNHKTCFLISLPIDNAHQAVKLNADFKSIIKTNHIRLYNKNKVEMIDKPISAKERLEKPSLLIVDDSLEIRLFLKNEFIDKYIIYEAENGKQAIEIAYETNLDLIISDVMMPEMSGFELCRYLKTKLKTSHIPIILLTAKSNENSLIEGLETGADAYISKPFNLSILEVRIRKLLEVRNKLRKLYSNSFEPDPRTLVTNSIDEEFLAKAINFVEDNIDNSKLNVEMFCVNMGMGRTKLHDKLKALTGKSVGEFIRSIRLKHAALLLKNTNLNVSEVCYSVGFSTMWYFSKCFKNEFNLTPSDFRKNENVDSGIFSSNI